MTMQDDLQKTTAQASIRRTFVAGVFSFVPLAVTAFIIWWIDTKTRVITQWLFHHDIPLLGVLIALVAIYVMGMITSSLLGRFFLRIVDGVLMHVPIVRHVYVAWKQVALTPGGTEGMFSRVVLIPDETGTMKLMGFTSGRIVEGEFPCYCVFVPSAPSPVNGRLFFVPLDKCLVIDMSPEEAFKIILSTGNYVPPLIAANKGDAAAKTAHLLSETLPERMS
ncbi:MAG: DUF502 domain-containing protein [Planctomycetota bacterium]|nr:DUF502 domain-containing protein [Planctomycetota bacterium]